MWWLISSTSCHNPHYDHIPPHSNLQHIRHNTIQRKGQSQGFTERERSIWRGQDRLRAQRTEVNSPSSPQTRSFTSFLLMAHSTMETRGVPTHKTYTIKLISFCYYLTLYPGGPTQPTAAPQGTKIRKNNK